MDDRADILIAGAGLAGLSLAAALVGGGYSGKLVLLEPRAAYRRDRTWAFWEPDDLPCRDAITGRWRAWRCVAPDGRATVCRADGVRYCMIAADDFYRWALRELRGRANVELRLGTSVERLSRRGEMTEVRADDGRTWRAPLAFDGRPRAPALRAGGFTLRQQFVGRFVRTRRPAFDPAVATLMDFSAPVSDRGVGFVYVLPTGDREALVEATVLAEQSVSAEALGAAVDRHLGPFGVDEVRHEERGSLAMTTGRFPPDADDRVVRIGGAAGWPKASTGYAFAATQRATAELARQVLAGEPARPPRVRSAGAAALDRIFLARLRRDPAAAPAVFARLFERVAPASLVRFLDDRATPLDLARTIAAMPKWPYAAEAVRSWRAWLRP